MDPTYKTYRPAMSIKSIMPIVLQHIHTLEEKPKEVQG